MRFSHAIVRPPGATFAAGITQSRLGPPDPALALAQHETYCRTLERLGLALVRLAADPEFPDGTFVEDAAVVVGRDAILTRPGAPSRAGEVTSVGAALATWFPDLDRIAAPGTLDGGDLCQAGPHCFIGVSGRTNAEGAGQLAAWLRRRGLSSSLIDLRPFPGLLHLKTGLTWLGGRRLLAVGEVAGHEALSGWEVVRVPEGEEYAANCLVVNGAVLTARGFPATAALLGGLGYDVVTLEVSEHRKMDGGLTCLSVRW